MLGKEPRSDPVLEEKNVFVVFPPPREGWMVFSEALIFNLASLMYIVWALAMPLFRLLWMIADYL